MAGRVCLITSASSSSGWRWRIRPGGRLAWPLDPDGLYDVLHQAQGAAGVRKFSLHALRHLYCSLLQQSGASFKHAQERMGHASPLTTLNVYRHTVTDEGRMYVEKVEAGFLFVSGTLEGEARRFSGTRRAACSIAITSPAKRISLKRWSGSRNSTRPQARKSLRSRNDFPWPGERAARVAV